VIFPGFRLPDLTLKEVIMQDIWEPDWYSFIAFTLGLALCFWLSTKPIRWGFLFLFLLNLILPGLFDDMVEREKQSIKSRATSEKEDTNN
jgi:hypothetical protein